MSSDQRKRRRASPKPISNDASYEGGVDLRLFTADVAQQVKRYINEVLEHPRTIIRIKLDGSVIITPNPRLLPNHIIATILLHVSQEEQCYKTKNGLFQCALVNKQFYMLANPLLWRGPFRFMKNKSPNRFVSCLENGRRPLGHQVRDLHLSGGDGCWTDLLLLRLIQHIPHLDSINMYSTPSITDASFQYLPRLCPRLTNLSFKSSHLARPSFWAVGQFCHQLRKLTLLQCQNLPVDLFDLLLPCPLEDIHISYHNLTGDGDGDGGGDVFLNETSMVSLKQFHSLACLKINAPHIRTHAIKALLTPTSAESTAQPTHWPLLNELDLAPCHSIDDMTLIPFLQSHPFLATLELRQARLLTDFSLTMMTPHWLPHLTRIKLDDATNISPEGVRHFIRHSSPDLVSVILNECDRISTSNLAGNDNTRRRCQYVIFDEKRIARMRQEEEEDDEEPTENNN